ncbi:hypothetical protein R6Q59_037099 [Mikania micrantha]
MLVLKTLAGIDCMPALALPKAEIANAVSTNPTWRDPETRNISSEALGCMWTGLTDLAGNSRTAYETL